MLSKALVFAVICLFVGASVFVPSILGFGTGNEDNGDKQRDWEIETVDSAGDTGWCTSIALDSNDYPHISYGDDWDTLKYAKWNGATWDIETVDSAGNVGEYCSLALDSSDYPHISYRDKDNDALKHAWWDGTTWHIETVEVIPGSYNVRYTSIAIDSNDKSHIAYKDYESDDLKYAKNTAGTWETEIVDSTGDTGWYLSIALDSNDYPHISFSDWPGYNYRLKYAKWNGTEWGIEIVDTAVDAGKFTSIALDSYDCPHISYNDGNLDDLKYAKKAPPEDTTPPETTCELEGEMEGDVYISDVTVYLNATDDISGVNYTMYKLDHGEFEIYEEPFVVSEDGEHTVYFYSVDFAGNIEEEKSCTFTIEHPYHIEIEIKGGLGVNVIISNNGEVDVEDVEWVIHVEGGILGFVNKTVNDTIDIEAGKSETVGTGLFLGFGGIEITATAGDEEKTAKGIQIIILTFIKK